MQPTAWSSTDHYENFPVGSWLLPARLRPAVAAVYRFAREADDIADEGDLCADERLRRLGLLDRALRMLQTEAQLGPEAPPGSAPSVTGPGVHHEPEPDVIRQLRPHIAEHALPVAEFRALIDAFSQDLRVDRYPSRPALLDYCRRSANPVGRLMLRLFHIDDTERVVLSDRICSALQWINFLQDVGPDWRKGRVYLPQETLAEAGSGDHQIAAAARENKPADELRRAIALECDFARTLLASGAPLLERVPWQLSLELRAILAGGRRVLDRIVGAGYDVFSCRPTLGWRDGPALLWLALSPPRRRIDPVHRQAGAAPR